MEKIYQKISYILPKKLVYYVIIRAWATATVKWGNKTPDEIPWSDVVKLYE